MIGKHKRYFASENNIIFSLSATINQLKLTSVAGKKSLRKKVQFTDSVKGSKEIISCLGVCAHTLLIHLLN